GRQRHDVERADQVDLDDLGEEGEVVRALAAQDALGGTDAGAVDDRTQRHARLAGDVDSGRDLQRVGHVDRHVGDAVDRRRTLDRGGKVEGEDRRTLGGEGGSRGGTQSGGASGDDGGGVVDLHGVPSLL